MTLISHTKLVTLLCFYTSGLLFFILNNIPYEIQTNSNGSLSITVTYFLITGIILAAFTLIPLGIFKIIALFANKGILKFFSIPAAIPLTVLLPLTYPILLFQQKFTPKEPIQEDGGNILKRHLLDILELESHANIEGSKKRLVTAVANFDDKTCREVMVPKVRVESLQDSSSIFEALSLFIEEGYSRLPIYEKSIDHITGMLLYKDVLEYTFKKGMQDLDTIKKAKVSSLVTPILYAPENKKISDLFQVMRARKIHAAVVVNEYGCTEGLITIEDIFEELIGGEILDEHDEEDDLLYKKSHDKGWIVEADLSIIDAEREFGIALPHDAEYETIGGLISTTMGVIPKPGAVIHFDGYEIKVLSSNERKILKVKISFEEEPLKN